jgi:PAS domain S-box-containing protein
MPVPEKPASNERCALQEQEILQAIFENIPVMITFFDPAGRIMHANREWERAFGWTVEEARQVDILAESYPDPEQHRKVIDFIRRAERRWVDFKPRTRDGRFIDTTWIRVRLSDGSGLGIGVDITERKQAEETVKVAHERLRLLSRRLFTAQEEERRRVAVELHDQLGQVLTAVKIDLTSLARLSDEAARAARLCEAIASVDRATETVRSLALDLRPSVLDDLGLSAALRWHVDRFARDAQVEVHLSIDAVPDLDPGVETACFRVAQEALTNVARHARALHVWLDLHAVDEGLSLRVRDDGVGFDVASARDRANAGASMGLLGMEERVSLMGGTHEIVTSPAGTEVRACFPMGVPGGGAQ